jgi:hypothetical protein
MSQSKKPSLLQSVIGMAVIVTVIFVILFSGASAITQENIKQHLDHFAEYMAKDVQGQTRTGKFSYGDIVINGMGFNKSAVVSNVSIEMSEKSTIDTPKWSISTEKMLVLPDPTMPSRLYFVFPDPINIIENSQLKTTITSSTPIKYSFTEISKDNAAKYTHALFLPNQIIFTPAKAAGDESAHANRTIVSLGDNAKLVEQFTPAQNKREAQVVLNNIKIDSDEGADTTIGAITAKFLETDVENNQVQGQYSWDITDVSGPSKEEKDGKPYSMNGDIAFQGEAPGIEIKNMAPVFGNTEFTVNKWTLSNDDFKILAQGKVAITSDDPLPSGNLSVSIENAGQFINSYLVPSPARAAITAAFQKVTGQPVEAQTHVYIPLKRDKNGVFYVGDLTFEALTASLAADALKLPPSVLPPTETPSTAPAEQPLPGLPVPVAPTDQPAAAVPPATTPATVVTPPTLITPTPVPTPNEAPATNAAPVTAPAVTPITPAPAQAQPAAAPPATTATPSDKQ